MNDLSTTIQHSFGHYFRDFLSRVQMLAADLSEEEFWRNPYPYGSTIALVIATLEQQQEADWSAAYSADGVDDVHDRFTIFLRCAVHFHHHIGHMTYTKDELVRQRR